MFFNEKHIWITGTTGDYCCNRKLLLLFLLSLLSSKNKDNQLVNRENRDNRGTGN